MPRLDVGRGGDGVIDPDFHKTDGYKDSLGRVAFTVYDDGSFTQTLWRRRRWGRRSRADG